MKKVTLKPLLLPVISLIIFTSWFSQTANPQTAWVQTVFASETFTGKLVGVSDGDTISVIRGGQAVKVRLHGIDCPEKKQPFGRQVTVRVQTYDRYGRTVATFTFALIAWGKRVVDGKGNFLDRLRTNI